MDVDTSRIQKIFDYMSAQDALEQGDGALVFSRADTLLAQLASEVYDKGFAKYLVFTGGLGKDSGFLAELNIAEANFLAACTNIIYNVPTKDIYRETLATNAAENARLGLETILHAGLPLNALIVITHATSLRRLAATLEQEIANKQLNLKVIKQATPYAFDPSKQADQFEACSELVKLEDYAKNGWCKPQTDVPQELATYARELLVAWK